MLPSNPMASMRMPKRTKAREHILSESELVEVYTAASGTAWPYGAIV